MLKRLWYFYRYFRTSRYHRLSHRAALRAAWGYRIKRHTGAVA